MSLQAWRSSGAEEKLKYCASIERDNEGVRFVGLRIENAHDPIDVAVFEFAGKAYRLVPGGEYQLGYSLENPRSDEEKQLIESFDSEDLEFVRTHFSPLRSVYLPAFLIAEEAVDLTDWQLNEDWTEVPDHIRSVHPELGERVQGRREVPIPVEDAMRQLLAQGLELCTEDQWEAASASGEPWLFRWKEIPPLEYYPSQTQENTEKRRVWVDSLLGAGSIDEDGASHLMGSGDYSSFMAHFSPTALGLKMGAPFNRGEICSNGVLKGGDGGEAECGGYNSLYAWLPLSPFYRNQDTKWEAGDVRPIFRLAVRGNG